MVPKHVAALLVVRAAPPVAGVGSAALLERFAVMEEKLAV